MLGTPGNTVFSQRARAHASLPAEAVLPAQAVSAPSLATSQRRTPAGSKCGGYGQRLLKVGPHSGRNWWRVWRSTCVPKKEGPSGEMGAPDEIFPSQRPLGFGLDPKLLILTVTWGILKIQAPSPGPRNVFSTRVLEVLVLLGADV